MTESCIGLLLSPEDEHLRSIARLRKNGYHYISRLVALHREIVSAPPGAQVDHINGDKLDNRRENLRICTAGQNQANRRVKPISRSKEFQPSAYKGVSWCKAANKWRAAIVKDSRQKHLGVFVNEVDAAHAYDKAAVELFGDFARTNFG